MILPQLGSPPPSIPPPAGPAPASSGPAETGPGSGAPAGSRLRDAALELEASFLKEMLAAAGFGRAPKGFGGGPGEEQFSSFLLDAQAHRIAEAGGIGLAESILRSMERRYG